MKLKHKTIEDDVFGFSKNKLAINSKNKGNVNERICAKSLSEWVGVKFTRVPQSGGIRNRENYEGVVGDIVPDTTNKNFKFQFVVETKHLQTMFHQRILRNNSILFSIWEQPNADSIRANKLPMAMLRSNHMNSGEYYLILEASQGGRLLALDVPVIFSGSNHTFSLIGFLFSDVKRLMPYTTFAKAVSKHVTLPLGKSKLYEQD